MDEWTNVHFHCLSYVRETQVGLQLTKKLKQRNATVHAEWRQPGGPVGMRWVRARAAASPALRSHKRVITSLTDTLSHFSASASMCLCLPPSLRLLKRISSHPWQKPVLALSVCLCLSFGWVLIKHEIICMYCWNEISFSSLSLKNEDRRRIGGDKVVKSQCFLSSKHGVFRQLGMLKMIIWHRHCSIAQLGRSRIVSHTFDGHC